MLVVVCLAGLVSWLVVCSLGQLDQLIDQSVGWWVSPSGGRSMCQAGFRSVCRSVDQVVAVGTWQVVGSVFSVTQSVGQWVCRSVD